jgi:hypothetical protein
MCYKNAIRLQALLFIVVAMILPSTAVAEDRSASPAGAQAASAQVPGVEVSLEQVSGGKVLTTRTDEKGSFTFSGVAPGSYKLRVGCARADAISSDVAGRAEQRCYAEFRIEITDGSTGVITGAVRSEGTRK